jgi:hypothetical protein
MKTKLLSFLLSLGIASCTYGQTNNLPALSKIMNWTEMSYEKFDADARASGFSFDARTSNGKSISYTYSRKTLFDNQTYIERVVYKVINEDHSTAIQMVMVNDMLTFYSPQYAKNGFKVVDCNEPATDGEASFCYESMKYKLFVKDTKLPGMQAHQYSAVIFKK